MFTIFLLISFNFISNSEWNETLYNYLWNNSEFEIIDIDLKNISNKRNIDEITVNDIITLSKVIYSLY